MGEHRDSGTSANSDRHVLVSGGLWNAAQVILPMLGTVTLSIALGRVLGPDLLGIQSLISYSAALLAGLLVVSLSKAALQAIAAAVGELDHTREKELVRWSLLGQVLNGTLSAAVLVTVGIFSDYPWAWLIAGATLLIDAATWGYAAPLVARSGRWAPIASRRLWTQLLAQVCATTAVLLGAGLVAVFAANLIASALLFIMVFRLSDPLPGQMGPLPRILLTVWFRFAVLQLLVQVVAQRVEFIFLAVHSDAAQIAMYSISFMVVSAIVTIPLTVATSGIPALAARESAGEGAAVATHLGSAVRVVAAMSIPLTVGTAALGPALITVLYGETFEHAGTLLIWMAPLLLVLPASALCETYWFARAEFRIPIRAGIVAAIVDLVACAALIPRYEALGAAWANVAGQATAAILLLGATSRARREVHVDPRRTVISLLASTAVGAGAWWCTQWLLGLAGLLIGIAFALAGFAAYARLVGFVAGADAAWLQKTVPARLRGFARLLGDSAPSPVSTRKPMG